jgi:hypothetical protein
VLPDDIRNIFLGALGSLTAVVFLWLVARGRDIALIFGKARSLAAQLTRGGISRFHLSRSDYHGRRGGGSLPNYIAQATQSIDIVSISLRLTDQEGGLVKIFRQKLAGSHDFRCSISLLNPNAQALGAVAASLDVRPEMLRSEIRDMLRELADLRNSLGQSEKARFRILLHDAVPMGSAILIDATTSSGTIQVETKLYRAPRTESFGYEVVAPSPFYQRNYTAWKRVLEDSKDVSDEVHAYG